jgi:Spy/CpxP family protein refolding chaperone
LQVIRWLFLCALSLALSACGKPQPRAPEDVVREAEVRKEPEFFNDLSMTQTQRRQVLTLIDKLYADFAEYDRTRLILLDETIAQIKRGQLERAKLLPLADTTIKEFEKAFPLGIDALQRLHGILTREQREKLVALFTDGRQLSDEERRKARDNRYGKILGLTAGQKASLYPALLALYIKHWGTIGRFRSALHEAQDAFIEDHLVAKELAIASDLDLLSVGEVIFDALEIGINHLTREQHATLAALLDSQLRSPNPAHTAKATTSHSPDASAAPQTVKLEPSPMETEQASVKAPDPEAADAPGNSGEAAADVKAPDPEAVDVAEDDSELETQGATAAP